MTTQFVKNPIKCFPTTITVLPCVSCTPDVHGIPGEGPDRHQSAARTLRPLLGVVDELLRKMLTLLPVRRPHFWPLHDAALYSGQIPKLRLQPWQAANKLELDKPPP